MLLDYQLSHISLIRRLPLPAVQGWMVLAVDLNRILASYCQSGPTPSKGPELQLRTLQVSYS